MDWKALGNIAALVGVLVAMVVMFNQVNGFASFTRLSVCLIVPS